MVPIPDGAPALRLDGVSRRFRAGKRVIQAVDGVDARVERGSVTGLVGPDGAGKTTLMRLVTGLLRADSGRIEVLGLDMARDVAAIQGRIGYMPQRFGLYEDLTVRENLDLYADLQDVPKSERGARYDELLHMTGLGPFTGRFAGRLSGGMKQKLGLACTLVRAPDLLFLDEPTVGVDPVSRRELWAIIDRLTGGSGMTVLISTSYLDEAERCGTVLLMHEGKLIGADSPATFTAPLAGRSYRVAAAGLNKRRLHERLDGAPGILDATIQGAYVRIVTETADPPSLSVLLPGLEGGTVKPVPPRFEDAFVARLRRDRPLPPLPPAAEAGVGTAKDGEIIVVRDVSRLFGSFTAVDRIGFSVGKGEIFGLLGANGAGKSTTFRMLCGLLPPSGGTLKVAGYDLRRAAAAARGRIGYMAQKFSLYADLSVMDNLRFFSSAYRLVGARRRQRIAWALDEFDLGQVADSACRDLSLGYKQRLALAAALMHEPDILFLDEPTSGVDPLARRDFWRRINRLAEEGVTVLVTTHFMEEAEYCDRLVIMAQGRILATGTPESLRDRFRSERMPDPTMEDAFIALLETAPAGMA